jgi:methylmalonyl-CoA/ethylmalonyl-CoA epimerase
MDGSKWFLGDGMKQKIVLDHIGIATEDLEGGSKFWSLIGLHRGDSDELVADQGVTTRFFSTDMGSDENPPKIELLEPTSEDTPIGKFLAKRGAGIQQICFRVEDILSMINLLKENGIVMIDEIPRIGAEGKNIAFVHPKSTGGVLVELTQYD